MDVLSLCRWRAAPCLRFPDERPRILRQSIATGTNSGLTEPKRADGCAQSGIPCITRQKTMVTLWDDPARTPRRLAECSAAASANEYMVPFGYVDAEEKNAVNRKVPAREKVTHSSGIDQWTAVCTGLQLSHTDFLGHISMFLLLCTRKSPDCRPHFKQSTFHSH